MAAERRAGPPPAPAARRAVSVLRAVLLALGLAVLLAACRVDTSVHVEVEDTGSGTVTVVFNADAVAVARVPELAGGLRFDDAQDAGWVVDGPLFRADGGVQIRAVKRFESATQLSQVLEEVAGTDVIFTDVVLQQEHSFAETFSASGPTSTRPRHWRPSATTRSPRSSRASLSGARCRTWSPRPAPPATRWASSSS